MKTKLKSKVFNLDKGCHVSWCDNETNQQLLSKRND